MTAALDIWADNTPLGVLQVNKGNWSLTYLRSWCTSDTAYPLSPHLPLQPGPHDDHPEDRRVYWYFENLLPEGNVREAYARHSNLRVADTFGLLREFGREGAGALTLVPEGAGPPGKGDYELLAPQLLRELILDIPKVPFGTADGRAKMSLAGAQHKLAMHWDENGYWLPRGVAPSTWLAKPNNLLENQYPHTVANEHFCMKLAEVMGLEVPECTIQHLPEPLYLVRRYDRIHDDALIQRKHQIDLCQLLNKWPQFKYESGGATLIDVFQAADQTRQPAKSRLRLLRWLIFNYLIGNSDAHAKNISFMVSRGGIDLAPHYDLLSVAVYGDLDMAMTISDQVRYQWVERDHWEEMGKQIGVKPRLVLNTLRDFATQLPARASELCQSTPAYTPQERKLVIRICEIIAQHATHVLRYS